MGLRLIDPWKVEEEFLPLGDVSEAGRCEKQRDVSVTLSSLSNGQMLGLPHLLVSENHRNV